MTTDEKDKVKFVPSKEVKLPPALPENIEDWTRYTKAERTLNDLVEEVHRALVAEPEYRALLRAVTDGQAVEGSLAMDDALAVQMVRKKAVELKSEVANEKLGPIKQALGVVLRRYHQSRKQRRNMIGGEEVPSDNGNE
jgi:hypothetical protein